MSGISWIWYRVIKILEKKHHTLQVSICEKPSKFYCSFRNPMPQIRTIWNIAFRNNAAISAAESSCWVTLFAVLIIDSCRSIDAAFSISYVEGTNGSIQRREQSNVRVVNVSIVAQCHRT